MITTLVSLLSCSIFPHRSLRQDSPSLQKEAPVQMEVKHQTQHSDSSFQRVFPV